MRNSPKLSAAVILYRERPVLEVFWARRAPHLAFQGGFHAFPGGQLEPGEDPRAGAVREFAEETGCRLDSASLREAGRWVTPPFSPRRFDTQFFLAPCPQGEGPATGPLAGELDFGEWVTPADALSRWRAGKILMAPPVRHALERLSEGLRGIEERIAAIPQARGAPALEIELLPGIVLVPLKTPTLPPATHTNCYIIGEKDAIVIDPAADDPREQAVLDGVLERRGVRVREIWLTHLHADHVGGANHLRTRWNAPIAAHPITAQALRGRIDADREFGADETAVLEGNPGWTLHVLHTPGHARGHVCVFESRLGALIAGDLMAGFGTIVIDPPEGHMATYLDSLRRMQALPVTALFPAHGPAMAAAKLRIQQYIDHRIGRENAILAAWERGVREPAAIVRKVYRDVGAHLYALAERSVAAHLEKLREESRV